MIEIDMKNVINGRDNDNFHCELIRLMFKADMRNFHLLSKSFPNTAKVVKHYKETGEILKGVPYE